MISVLIILGIFEYSLQISLQTCQTGQFLNAGFICEKCDTNCKTCIQTSQHCISCREDKKLKLFQGKCINIESKSVHSFHSSQILKKINNLCRKPCKKCILQNDGLICIQTHSGFAIVNNNIIKCSQNCLSCSESNSCNKCISGFYLLANKCLPCSQNCLNCNNNICYNCQSGYYNVGKQCTACDLQHCSQCTSEGKCTICQQRYFYIQELNKCQQCPSNCNKCSNNNINQCLQCEQGFYLSNNVCKHCSSACLSCSDQKKSITWQNCQFPCAECHSSIDNNCTKCFPGYLLKNNKCIRNAFLKNIFLPVGIQLSDNYRECLKCQVKYCTIYVKNKTEEECLYCMQGYFQNNNTCLKCPTGCQSCLNNLFCINCKYGYVKLYHNLIESNHCYPCQYPCATCKSQRYLCTSCLMGYTLMNRKCIKDAHIYMRITFKASIKLLNGYNFYIFKQKLMKKLTINSSVHTNIINLNTTQNGLITLEIIQASEDLSFNALCQLTEKFQFETLKFNSISIVDYTYYSSIPCFSLIKSEENDTALFVLIIFLPSLCILSFFCIPILIICVQTIRRKYCIKNNQTQVNQEMLQNNGNPEINIPEYPPERVLGQRSEISIKLHHLQPQAPPYLR